MRRGLLLATFLAALFAPASASAGIVSGTVTPISIAPEVDVCVVETGVESEICDSPDASGKYMLSRVPEGIARIEFLPSHRSGYLTQYYRFAKTLAESTTILVPPLPGKVNEIDAALEPGGTITGTVTALSTGAPLADVEACALEGASVTPVSCADTDAAGAYAITTLPTGTYRVSFRGLGTSADYARQFYSGGSAVQVEAGQVRSGIDAALVPGAQVTGTVTAAATGARLPGVPVCLFAAGQASATQCAFTDAFGGYALRGIATGSYQIGFSLGTPTIGGEAEGTSGDGYLPQYFDGVANRFEAQTISLSGEEAAGGVDAALQTPSPPPPPPPPAPVVGNVIPPPPAIAEPTRPKPLKCKKGTVKKKVKKVARCVKKSAKKGRHHKSKRHGHKSKRHGQKAERHGQKAKPKK